MNVKELRELIATMPDDARVYGWIPVGGGDQECCGIVHRATYDVESPMETSIHFDIE